MKKAEHHIRMAIGEIRAAKADLGEDGTNGSYVWARLHLINTYLQECKGWLDAELAKVDEPPPLRLDSETFVVGRGLLPATPHIRFDRIRVQSDPFAHWVEPTEDSPF